MAEVARLSRIEDAEARLRLGRRMERFWQLWNAKALSELRELDAHRERGTASFRHYAEDQGFGVVETAQLQQTLRATQRDERVEPFLLAGRIPIRSAAALDRALSLPTPEPVASAEPDRIVAPTAPERDWVDLATRLPSERFCDEVAAAAARTHPQPPQRLTTWVTEEARRLFRRARRLAMRKERRVLTEGEALGVVSRYFVEKHDRRYRRYIRRRARRGLSTQAAARTRRVTADVQHEVAERDRESCVVGLCPDEAFLDFGHLYVPYSEGGPATVGNLARQCHAHNDTQYRGWITVVRHESGPIFLDRHGFVVERERRPDEPRRRLEEFLHDLRGSPGAGPAPP